MGVLLADGPDWTRLAGAGVMAAGLAVALAPAPFVQRGMAEAVAANPKVNKTRVQLRLFARYGWISVVGLVVIFAGLWLRSK